MCDLAARLSPPLEGPHPVGRKASADGAAGTTLIRIGTSIVLVACLSLAGCELEPLFEPDVGVNLTQVSGLELKLARVIEPAELGIPGPAGLAYSSRADQLLVVTPGLGSSTTDVHLVTLSEQNVGTIRLPAGVTDPVNMTFDGRANRLLILQSANNRLVVIRAGSDGSLAPQTLERIDARSFGVQDAQGLAVDPASGVLFVLDASGPRLVRVEPDAVLGFAGPTVSAVDLTDGGFNVPRGLAFDPVRRTLHILDPADQALHEVTETGEVVAVRSVSEFGLVNPQGLTFAPSGDNTDDPSEMSLYVADTGSKASAAMRVESSTEPSGQILELALAEPAVAPLTTEFAMLIQAIDTWQFSPPSPDPAGITLVGSGDLLISDSEVNEMPIFAGANLFRMSVAGVLQETASTLAFSNEPTGVTWNSANNHLFYSDDTGTHGIYEVDPGADGLHHTSDDVVTSIAKAAFGSTDPEGVTYDSSQGVLFVADGVNREIYRIAPGPNGVFDGVDDVVSHFDTYGFGLDDPEGIAYDSDFGHLYAVGQPSNLVFHFTTAGQLLRTIDISAAGPKRPAGLAYAPSSVNPLVNSLWLVARGVDNNSDPDENDGMAYELSLPAFSGDAPPAVTITAPPGGSTFTEGTSITFSATASDPEDGNLSAAVTWTSSLNGSLGTGASVTTSALSIGTHTITASVMDSGGQPASDAIFVTVNPEGFASLEVRVAASTDDAEESASGSVSRGSSDLEMVYDRGGDQTVGLRFNGVDIPPGATIISASIQFQVDETHSAATSLTIQGEATDDAVTFAGTNGDISSRGRTASAVPWSPVPWTTRGVAGPDQQTPDIAPVIQEIVSRPGWASGNSLAIIISGTGERVAEAYDGVPAAAPLLRVGYVLDPGHNAVPTASNVQIAGTPIVGEQLTGTYTYSDGEGDPEGSSQYRWLRNGTPISGATTRNYTLVAEDEGALIVFEVTPVASSGASPGAPAQSAALGPVVGSGGSGFVLDVRVSTSSDDGEEKASGSVRLTSSDLELVYDGSDQTVGMRFNSVTVPRGATITNATIQFQVDETQSVATSLTIQGEATDNAVTFAAVSRNISSRARTASSVAWSPAPWTNRGEAGPDQLTPNIGGIVQEIVSRPGWSSGNSLVIIVTGTGERVAEAYDGVPDAAPLLHIEYSLEPS